MVNIKLLAAAPRILYSCKLIRREPCKNETFWHDSDPWWIFSSGSGRRICTPGRLPGVERSTWGSTMAGQELLNSVITLVQVRSHGMADVANGEHVTVRIAVAACADMWMSQTYQLVSLSWFMKYSRSKCRYELPRDARFLAGFSLNSQGIDSL